MIKMKYAYVQVKCVVLGSQQNYLIELFTINKIDIINNRLHLNVIVNK